MTVDELDDTGMVNEGGHVFGLGHANLVDPVPPLLLEQHFMAAGLQPNRCKPQAYDVAGVMGNYQSR